MNKQEEVGRRKGSYLPMPLPVFAGRGGVVGAGSYKIFSFQYRPIARY
jgi:hypothetical protein